MTKRVLLLAATLLSSLAVHASTLTLSVRTHSIIRKSAERGIVYGVFADEHLIVDTRLDVYMIPKMPSTSESFGELRQLSAETWIAKLKFRLTRSDGTDVPLSEATVSNQSVRRRGPNAPLVEDRDASVECTTYRATLDFNRLPVGSYSLEGRIGGISSQFDFVVPASDDSEWRDLYLEEKSSRAKNYTEYRELALERLRDDSDRLDILLDLIDQSLQYGSLDETRAYIDRAKSIVKRRKNTGGTSSVDMAKSIDYLTEFYRALPEYFRHRSQWTMLRDATDGRYVIRSRVDGKIVKEIGRER